MTHIPPAFIVLLGCLPIPILHGWVRNAWTVFVPAATFVYLLQLDVGSTMSVGMLQGFGELQLLRVDKLSLIFGYIFTLNATASMLYGFYLKENSKHLPAMAYVGCALGAIFAGDILTLYVFWELMAVTSTFLILARRTEESYRAGFRYMLVHVFGGLLLLAGILLRIHENGGDTSFVAFNQTHAGTWLMLLGILVNAAAWPMAAWLPDAYANSSLTAGVFLSAYTTKTAVYALIRGFAGWDILVWVGVGMAIYGIIYALLENDIRRILAHSIINQVGFMVVAIGIGSDMALNGAAVHAFCHILYKSLLWMSAGAIIYRTGCSKFTELGGMARSMPRTAFFGSLGALSMASFPLTCAYASKAYLMESVAASGRFWPWMMLEIAAAGIFVASGLKFMYGIFFSPPLHSARGLAAPTCMVAAMSMLALLNFTVGLNPGILLYLMPWSHAEAAYPYALGHLAAHLQLLSFGAIIFFLLFPWIRGRALLTRDTDWIYRQGSRLFYLVFNKALNGLNVGTYQRIVQGIIPTLANWVGTLQGAIVASLVRIGKGFRAPGDPAVVAYTAQARADARIGSLPVGLGLLLPLVMLIVLLGSQLA